MLSKTVMRRSAIITLAIPNMLSSFLAPTNSGASLDESPAAAAFPAGLLPDTGTDGTTPPDPPKIPRHFIAGGSAGPAAGPAGVVLDAFSFCQGARRPHSPPPPPGGELTGAPA